MKFTTWVYLAWLQLMLVADCNIMVCQTEDTFLQLHNQLPPLIQQKWLEDSTPPKSVSSSTVRQQTWFFRSRVWAAATASTWATVFIFFGSWESLVLVDSWTVAIPGVKTSNSAKTLAVIESLFYTNKNSLAQLARSGFSKSQCSNFMAGSLFYYSLIITAKFTLPANP